jgi:carbamoyltransferase
MIILGIHDGHNASATLLKNGKIICSIAEERLSRQKNHYGFPFKAIDNVLKLSNLSKLDIDFVAMSSKHLPPSYYFTQRNSKLTIQDYWKEQKEYWYPKIYENKNPKYLDVLSHCIDESNFPYDKKYIKNESDNIGMWNARVSHASEYLKIDKDKITHHDHHMCHAYYGYLGSPNRNREQLVYTMDGFGDGANGTVSIGIPGKELNEISRSSNCNIGRIYRYATLLLGMRPAEHEYKLMGLAAYNFHKYGEQAYKVYANTLQVDGLKFKYKTKIKDHFFYFKKKLEGQRFDAIAYGIQKRCEELLTEWISNGIKETGIQNIVMSGGVAQNIKANKLIGELNNLKSLFIPPGPGDESISIGAAYLEYISKTKRINDIDPISGYLGPTFSEDEIINAIKTKLPKNYLYHKADDIKCAKILSKGQVIARFSDEKMEFGARALGNRSILADPRRPDVIHKINKLVKMRDFWMPFAPSIIEDREKDYIINPKKIDARFMATGFDSTELAEKHIPAGLHPFDRTARPQIVKKKDNLKYYNLIKAFEDLTGVGALMNTSFNIHGESIVGTPEDAIDTFSRCGLDHLLLGDWLISKG